MQISRALALSWADSFRPNAVAWFDRMMRALEPFDVSLTLCFTPKHLGLEEHHTSPPKDNRTFAEFAAWAVRTLCPSGSILDHTVNLRGKLFYEQADTDHRRGGFRGLASCRWICCQAGHSVRVLDDLTQQVHPAGPPDYLSPAVELIRGDVRDPNLLKEVLRGIDVMYHFAATVGVGQSMYEISRYMSVNTQGTAELLQAILDTKSPIQQDHRRFLDVDLRRRPVSMLASAAAQRAPPVRSIAQLKRAMGSAVRRMQRRSEAATDAEDKPSEINSMYALSKRDQEEMCLIFGRTYGLPVTALRFFNIYGTRQALSNPYTGVAAIFASRMLNGNAPLVFEDGEQMRDFVSVHDIVRANMLAMERPNPMEK